MLVKDSQIQRREYQEVVTGEKLQAQENQKMES